MFWVECILLSTNHGSTKLACDWSQRFVNKKWWQLTTKSNMYLNFMRPDVPLRRSILSIFTKLVRALWLVNSAGVLFCTAFENLKFCLLPNFCVIYLQIFLALIASKSLNLSFTLYCILKPANDLKTISNWFVLLLTCFRNFEAFLHEWKSFPNPSDTK